MRSCTQLLLIFGALYLVINGGLAFARDCFLQHSEGDGKPSQTEPVRIVVASDDHPHFSDFDRRCKHYWPYFSGQAQLRNGEVIKPLGCKLNANRLSLNQGYAPLGVFFRSSMREPDKNIASYLWIIRRSGEEPALATFDSFNAAFVFEKSGHYTVQLTVKFKNGSSGSDQIEVEVWPRSGTTYYVDSATGDDRNDGRSTVADKNCNPDQVAVGKCSGPWKTATRAFGVLSPRTLDLLESETLTADQLCSNATIEEVAVLPGPDVILKRTIPKELWKEIVAVHGEEVRLRTVAVCEQMVERISGSTKPGDQVLLRRGQTFALQTGLMMTRDRNYKVSNAEFQVQALSCAPLVSPNHWQTPMGVLFAAYGEGTQPNIQNVGEANCILFKLTAVGGLHLALQDLRFDLESKKGDLFGQRATFMYSVGQALNTVINRVTITNFKMGILFHNAHGMFIVQSRLFDSTNVHLYSSSASDVALLNNNFDYSGNHIAYTNFGNSIVRGNSFSRQAFGRTALRVFGTGLENPTRSIWISDNSFTGWVDPRTQDDCVSGHRCQFASGKRYNYSMIELRPVNRDDRFSGRIVFTRNIIKNAENMMKIAGVEDLLVTKNLLQNTDTSSRPRIILNDQNARRPLRHIRITNNRFVESGNRSSGSLPSIFEIAPYSGVSCSDQMGHSDIIISKNRVSERARSCFLRLRQADETYCLSRDAQLVPKPFGSEIQLEDNKTEIIK